MPPDTRGWAIDGPRASGDLGTGRDAHSGADGLGGERPLISRIYDHLLGGSHNFGVDREAARRIVAEWPECARVARANRHFLRHTVEHAMALGVRQFLDLGAGIPTIGSVHELAQARDPDARVAYVEAEPAAVAHCTTMLEGQPLVSVTLADMRHVDEVFAAPGVAGLLDLAAPVAVLVLNTLHHVPDADDPVGVVARYRSRLAPGSLLALSHVGNECPERPEVVRRTRAGMERASATTGALNLRSRAQIAALADGFGTGADGLVDLGRWCAESPGDALGVYALVSEPLSSCSGPAARGGPDRDVGPGG